MSTAGAPGTRLTDLGEFAVIGRITARFAGTGLVEVGPGDDAAVLQAPDGRVVATTDLLVEHRHFRLDWSTPYDVGRKAAAQNLSDVAAMGARPTALLVGVGAPPATDVAVLEELASGLADECALVGATVAGGDLVRSTELVVAVTALGDLAGRAPVLRSGARPGDVIVVVGDLGGAAAGLVALTSGRADAPEELLDAHRRPTPPYAAGPLLAGVGATGLVDTSDGFVADLGHVLRASGVGARVEFGALPRHPALRSAWADREPAGSVAGWVAAGGEDHALVATLPRDRVADAGEALAAVGMTLTPVGEVVAGDGITWAGLPPGTLLRGFDHFTAP